MSEDTAMPSALPKRLRRALPLVAALLLLPLAGDANNMQCCAIASSYATSLFGGGGGDEEFFTIPGNSPNLMILLANSSTMLDFPQQLPFPTLAQNGDNSTALDGIACKALGLAANCAYTGATTYLNPHTNTTMAASATPPYDNGLATSTTRLVTDAPTWGLPSPDGHGTCTKRTTSGTGSCLFDPAGFYFYRTVSDNVLTGLLGTNGLGDAAAGSWSTNQAYEHVGLATNCALTRVPSTTNCQTALSNKGYYLFRDQRVNGNQKPYAALFAGWFLNLYPPKFVIARKIVKSLAVVDTDTPGPIDSVRLGLAILKPKTTGSGGQRNSISTTDGGTLVVPLGPNCSVYPVRAEDQTEPRQKIIDAINDPTKVSFGTASNEVMNQLAETLYEIGQYYSDYPDAGNVFTRYFTSSWVTQDANWAKTSAGTMAAPWTSRAGELQDSICFSCQQSSVAIITDGITRCDNNLPQAGNSIVTHANISYTPGTDGTGDFRKWSNGKIACPNCGIDACTTNSTVANLLQKVAAFLAETDLRPGTGMANAQTVTTSTISFGITAGSAAETLLTKTAELGGGTFSNASDATELEQALNDAATAVVARATGFSVASTPTLQNGQNTMLFVARFRPSRAPGWEGHLSRFRVFNEFAEGCDSTKPNDAQIDARCVTAAGNEVLLNPNRNGDTAGGNAVCTGVFILDADCQEVLENDTGDFMKATFDEDTHQLVPGTDRAVPFWDAGTILSTPTESAWRSAAETGTTRRMIYTVLDTNNDGKLTPRVNTTGDEMVELSTTQSSTARWTLLKSALAVDVAYCESLFSKMGVLNSSTSFTLSGTSLATALDECAKQVVWYVRGYDVLDEDDDGCGGPDFPSNATSCPTGVSAEQRDRVKDSRETAKQTFWKLGDVFHSTPVMVNPPADTFTCDLALDPQCVATIHSPQALSGATQTEMATYTVSGSTATRNAYEAYRREKANRQKLVLVGANDGMLHAFDAGQAQGTANVAGNYRFGEGTGAELWAFVPPDLLPKLKNALLNHDYFVDGNTMVRDVWADGSGAQVAQADGKKQKDEFHTVAVLSERGGGSEYVALDVTDPTSPKFRWMFPEPCSVDVSMMGQSWTGFAPRPPPIGPIKAPVASAARDPQGRGFEERWIAMVNGGYDPSLTRGRGIWMMDAWTGEKIWRFTNDDLQDIDSTGGMWPVPGSAALLDIGVGDRASVDSDGFFDTATWGDIGGTVYVARFRTPDKTTWAAARAFEEQRQANGSQLVANRSEFYFMPSNTVDPATGYLHTYLGSGNRERLLATGASCGPDNVFGCFQAGCNTDVTTSYDYGSCSYDVKAHANNGVIRQDRSSTSTTNGTACGDSITCSQVKVSFKVETVCNGWKPSEGSFHADLACDVNGVCATREKVQSGNGVPISRLTNPQTHNRFYGIWSFGGAGRTFDDGAGAATFDASRFTDVAFTGPCAGPTGGACTLVDTTYATVSSGGTVTCPSGTTTCSATAYAPGWFYEYGRHAACPAGGTCGTADWTDEKTGSGASVLASCVIWNSFRPAAAVGRTTANRCNLTAGTARNFAYLADFVTGVPSGDCGFKVGTALARAQESGGIAPPIDWIPVIARGKDGGTVYQQASFPPGGTPQSQQVGVGGDSNQMIYWLEVPRSLHACRHDDPDRCE